MKKKKINKAFVWGLYQEDSLKIKPPEGMPDAYWHFETDPITVEENLDPQPSEKRRRNLDEYLDT